MDELYMHIVAVLGKGPTDPAFRMVSQMLGQPSQVQRVGSRTIYHYFKWGLLLQYSETSRCFNGACFEFRTKSIRDGSANAFPGRLCCGIDSEDTKDTVREKIGFPPFYCSPLKEKGARGSCHREKYTLAMQGLPDCTFTFIFTSTEGPLGMLGISIPQWSQDA
jgi:hypothetical protein